jgi:pimeloyl-ACP methyl ester carboxylesterase
MNNPINAIDPDGRRVYFVAGAGNDSDGWNYASRFKSIWTSLGIKDFKRVNASHGKMGDIGFVNNYRNKQSYWTQGEFSAPNQHFATSDKQYQKALKGIINDLSKNPLKDGEQLNLTGYSYGAVLQEHLAIGLADKGYKIDNLILIGSPTSDGSDLMTKLQEYQEAGKIGNIIRHDIEGDLLSNPKSEGQFIRGGIQNSFLGDGDNGAHFDLARPGKAADKRIEQVGRKLQENGVK